MPSVTIPPSLMGFQADSLRIWESRLAVLDGLYVSLQAARFISFPRQVYYGNWRFRAAPVISSKAFSWR